MDIEELEIAVFKFKLKIYEFDGTVYENFFIEVMKYSDPNFKPVKARGSFGDKKNDGFDKVNGKYYQVYAPQNPSNSFDSAVKKCKKDFEGLYKHWNSISAIKEFYFVYNDKYKGTDSELEKELASIKKEYSLSISDTLLASDLQKIFIDLKDNDKRKIVGYIPNIDSKKVIEYSDLSEIIEHILNYKIQYESELTYDRNSEFFRKIELNKFSKSVSKLLDKSSYQIYAIEDYFKKNGSYKRELFAKKLSSIYNQIIKNSTINILDENYSDLIFFKILNQIKIDDRGTMTEASLALMSYYFEACDIFKTE